MPALLPKAVQRSENLYRRILRLYPQSHRQEFGPWMVQVFRDVCRQAYSSDGPGGLTKVWIKTLPDLASSVVSEHEYELRRWLMNMDKNKTGEVSPRWVMGLLISASIVALGMIASIVLREASGLEAAALVVVVVCNLSGALVMELSSQRDGAVLGSMGLLMLMGTLPLLWVPDKIAWIRENPLTLGVIILLAGYMRQKIQKNWPLYTVAIILGAAHILISFI